MAWVLLIIAGIFEIIWAVGLKHTDGFTRPLPSIFTITAMIISFVLLGFAMRTLPVGTAYGVWVGIGTVGAVIFGALLFDEPVSGWRFLFLLLIISGIIGLKMTTHQGPPQSIEHENLNDS